jgi:hypothetical protein
MESEIRGERDIKRDILLNLITSLVLEGELYFLVFHLTSSNLEN